MSKWEYTVLKYQLKGFISLSLDIEELDKALNQLGDEGWELVSCFGVDNNGYTKEMIATLKRQKEL